jgi:hypothetical protein
MLYAEKEDRSAVFSWGFDVEGAGPDAEPIRPLNRLGPVLPPPPSTCTALHARLGCAVAVGW